VGGHSFLWGSAVAQRTNGEILRKKVRGQKTSELQFNQQSQVETSKSEQRIHVKFTVGARGKWNRSKRNGVLPNCKSPLGNEARKIKENASRLWGGWDPPSWKKRKKIRWFKKKKEALVPPLVGYFNFNMMDNKNELKEEENLTDPSRQRCIWGLKQTCSILRRGPLIERTKKVDKLNKGEGLRDLGAGFRMDVRVLPKPATRNGWPCGPCQQGKKEEKKWSETVQPESGSRGA